MAIFEAQIFSMKIKKNLKKKIKIKNYLKSLKEQMIKSDQSDGVVDFESENEGTHEIGSL